MAGFIDKLMGLFSGTGKQVAATEQAQEIGGYTVVATPVREGAQYRLSGRIEKRDGEQVLVRRFIRADVFSSEQDAIDTCFRKAKQIIEQHGFGLFGDGETDRLV